MGDRKYLFLSGLSTMDEPELDIWVRAESIEEAYRYIAFPTFSSVELTRVYKKSGEFYLVRKLASRAFGRLLRRAEYKLEETHWLRLKTFMDTHFWIADSWSSNQVIIDGVMFLFEAWKDENYKYRYDHSIGERLASKAAGFFQQVYKESKKG